MLFSRSQVHRRAQKAEGELLSLRHFLNKRANEHMTADVSKYSMKEILILLFNELRYSRARIRHLEAVTTRMLERKEKKQ